MEKLLNPVHNRSNQPVSKRLKNGKRRINNCGNPCPSREVLHRFIFCKQAAYRNIEQRQTENNQNWIEHISFMEHQFGKHAQESCNKCRPGGNSQIFLESAWNKEQYKTY